MSNMVKSVEFFELSTSSTTVSGNLTKGQNYTNCVPFMSVRGGGTSYVDTILWDCYFTGTTSSGKINFERTNARSTTGYVNCYVVEFYPTEVYVEQGSFDLSSTTSSNITTVSGFNPNRTGMMHYWKSNNSNNIIFEQIMCRGSVTSSGVLNFYRVNATGSMPGHWFLFEAKKDQFSVEHCLITSTVQYPNCILSKSYDYLKTFIIASSAGGYTANYYSDRSTGYISLFNRNACTFTKATGANTTYTAAQIIEFKDQNIHVPYTDFPSLTATSLDFSLTSSNRTYIPIDLDSSMVINTPTYFDYDSAGSSTGAILGIASTVKFTSSSGIRIQKDYYANDTTPSIYVVDWKGYTVDTGSNSSPMDSNLSFAKSVQNSSISVQTLTNFIFLTKGQTLSNSVVFASQYAIPDGYCNNYLHDIYISDTGSIVAHRHSYLGQSSNATIDVSIVEFYPEKIRVQSGTFGGSGSLSPEATSIIPISIDPNKAFMIAKYSSTAYSYTWWDYNIRHRIIDSNNIGIMCSTGANNIHMTWFIVEDITLDNSCFKVTHWTINNTASIEYGYITGDDYCPEYNTFFITSIAGGYTTSFYADRSCCYSYYYSPNRPQIVAFANGSNAKWVSGQVVKITTNGRRHAFSLSTTNTTTHQTFNGVLPTSLSGVNNITVFNNTTPSYSYSNTGAVNGIPVTIFCSATITDYDAQTVVVNRGSAAYDSVGGFNVICWEGSSYTDPLPITPTKSLINSISKYTYTGSAKYNHWTLDECIDPKQCVPLATWNITANTYLYACYKYFNIDTTYDRRPYRLTMMSPTVGTGSATTQVYLVEFSKDQVKVQSGTYGSASGDFTITIEQVDLTKAFLVFYSYIDSNTYWRSINLSGVFSDSTTLRFRRTEVVGIVYVSWYVVECLSDQWYVQHVYSGSIGGVADMQVASNYIPELNRRLAFCSYAGGYSGAVGYADRSACKYTARTDNLQQISKYSASETQYYINFELVDFNKNIDLRVLWDDPTFVSASNTFDNFTVSPILRERSTIVFNPMFNNTNACNSGSTTYPQIEGCVLYELIDFDINAPKVKLTKVGASYSTASSPCVVEFPDFNKYYMEGYVKEQGVGVQREVRAYRTSTNELVDTTTSNSGTGYFFVETKYSDAHYLICSDDDNSPTYNDLIYSKIYPAVISGTFSYRKGYTTTSGLSIGIPLARL